MTLLPARSGLVALAALGCLVTSTFVTSDLAMAQDEDGLGVDDVPHITTQGAASAAVAADSAEIRLGVSVVKSSAADAWDADAKLAQALIDAAKGAGVQASDIASSSVSLVTQSELVRQPDGNNKSVVSGYRANHEYSIHDRDLGMIGSLTQLLIEKGANNFGGVSFLSSGSDDIRERLAADALRQARKKAEALAAVEKVKLGRLLKVQPPEQAARNGFMAVSSIHGAGMPIVPGTDTLSEEVEATFAIE